MSKREKTDSMERPGAFKEVKIVLVGPAKCGKTSLVQRFVNDSFSEVSFAFPTDDHCEHF